MAQQHTEQTELAWHMTGSAAEVADILVEFAEELRRGDVVVWKQRRELHIDPTGQIHMSVKAHKTEQKGLTIDMHWSK